MSTRDATRRVSLADIPLNARLYARMFLDDLGSQLACGIAGREIFWDFSEDCVLSWLQCVSITNIMVLPASRRSNGQIAQAELSLVHLKNCLVNLPPALVSLIVNVNTVSIRLPGKYIKKLTP